MYLLAFVFDKCEQKCFNMSMLKLKETAKILNVHVKTLQRWDRQGIFKAKRTPTNRRYYTEQMIEVFMNGETYKKERNM